MIDNPYGNNVQYGRICLFNSNKAWGGGEKWYLSTALMLQKRKYNVHLLAEKKCELFMRAQKSGIPVTGVKVSNLSFLNPVKIISLAYLLKQLRAEVIILNLSSDVKLAGIAARLAGVKKIIYRRGLPVPVNDSVSFPYSVGVIL